MEQTPLVSILLLSMNHERFIRKCISSLKEQTYKNIEIIYLDNASSDQTFEIGRKCLMESGLPCKYFSNSESNGISKNLNYLLSFSKGLYICALSTDDWLTTDSIEEKVKYFSESPSFGMVYNDSYDYHYDTNKIKKAKNRNFKEGWILKDILTKNNIITTGCMIKRNTFDTVGEWDEKSPFEDWDMWIRIAEKFPIGFVNKRLAYRGLRSGNNISSNFQYMNNGIDYILTKYAHYKEIEETKLGVVDAKSYYYATQEPSLKSLKYIIENSRFNFFYFKQIIKVGVGILKKKSN